ncbi:MAG: flagellar biosynthesis protein FlhF [Negativicutes bacterium]|nr:flagellar biosynthesis protein FlhF [Negativicutes bacterium]
MKVKLFTADTMSEAMAQVKNTLGRDAVILHTRRFRKGGFFGFFGKEMVEVMAAVDTAASMPPAVIPAVVSPLEKKLPSPRAAEEDAKVTALQLEIANMRKMLEQVLHKMPQPERANSLWLELLIRNDVDPQIAENIIKGLPDEKSFVSADPGIIKQLLCERLCSYLQRVEGITAPAHGSKAVALIGPTGVGKTTTIAKLAANFAIKEGCRVALITADTYRIAAVEQLKTYADIIGVPIEIVYSADDMKAALYRHRDKQLVLIDTAGRSPRNSYQLEELKAMLMTDPYIETHLVLSCSTKYKDALEIVDKFSICSPQKFLFTKIDEAANLGTIFNLVYQFPTTLSYVTNGQNVPDDIELANPKKMANLILRD